MASPEYELAVLIGRFQPFHNGHLRLLRRALELASQVVVVLGSAFQSRNVRNPFTWQEREAMIRLCLDDHTQQRVHFVPVRDYYDNERWAQMIREAVSAHIGQGGHVVLVGHEKDASSDYLTSCFPQWSFIGEPRIEPVDAVQIRKIYFETGEPAAIRAVLSTLMPDRLVAYLDAWRHLAFYEPLCREQRFIVDYRQTWGAGPFVTVDALVRVGGHVLLIQRAHPPGQGLWALPGGFLEGRERLLQAAVRELREETGITILDDVLVHALRSVVVFDHPDRSLRGRIITHVHFFDFDGISLPDVEGLDDAASASWIPVEQLVSMEDQCYADHFHMLDYFLHLLQTK